MGMIRSGTLGTTSYYALRMGSYSKLNFTRDVVNFGRFAITPRGIRPSNFITDAILNFPVPTDTCTLSLARSTKLPMPSCLLRDRGAPIQ